MITFFLRLVLDTDVVVAAMRSPNGASAAILERAFSGGVTLIASSTLAVEYESQCLSSDHVLAAGLLQGEALTFVNAVIALCEPATLYYLWRPQLRDPGDEMVLEAAINGHAEAIVTFNRRDYGTAPARFGIEIWSPAETLKRIRQ